MVTVPETCSSHHELVRLRLAVEASGEIIFMTDTTGMITYVNPEFVRVYGYTASEVVGSATPRILGAGVTPREEYTAFWRELASGRVVRREFINRTKSGRQVAVETSANPIVMNGHVVGFLAVQRDITMRKATEAALQESERRYRTLADAAQDAIFIVDRDARIVYGNAVSAQHFGFRIEDGVGRSIHDVFLPEAATEMWRELSTVFSTGERHYVEDRFETPCGVLWLGTWLVPMPSEGHRNSVEAVMGVARDITDRKRLEQEFTQAQKMEAIGRLAGGVAHDFNNLLTAILGYSDLLLDRVDQDPEIAGDLNEIRKAGERATRLTRQLLTFSRKATHDARVLNLNETITELQKMLGRLIGEDIHIDIALDPRLRAVKADPGKIEQLILNLAVNARDAMPQGGTLRISTANVHLGEDGAQHPRSVPPGAYVSMSMADNGCGMTQEVLTHVFEPFFTTKPAGKGTGLGLASVYGIVTQSAGHITIESTPGAGTIITTYFPLVDGDTALHTVSADAREVLEGHETVLIVEDDPALRRLMQRTLERHGYLVLQSKNVVDALSIAERHPGEIDLLLSDVIMPVMNGPDLAQRIVRLRPAIKVMYVSGFTNQIALDRGSLSTKACFLAKPFTPQALAERVRDCLESDAQTEVTPS
jgi:PAS domain S-box-containing protein